MPFSLNSQELVRPPDGVLRREQKMGMPLAGLRDWQPGTGLVATIAPEDLSRKHCDREAADGPDSAAAEPECAGASNAAIRKQLERILQSRAFIQSDKLCRFLRFVVEHAIAGDPSCLKEYTIGAEVYGRRPPYHPSQDSIVRTEARRLRGKLKEYYEVEGREDPIYVYLRPGRYVPVFHTREDLIGASGLQTAPQLEAFRSEVFRPEASRSEERALIVAAVFPFRDVSANAVSSSYARGIADELAYALMLTQGCMVISSSCATDLSVQEHGIGTAMNKAGVQIAYEGSVRAEGRSLRVTARIVDAAGRQLWVKRIDAEVDAKGSFAVEEQIALTLSTGFDALFGRKRRPNLLATL